MSPAALVLASAFFHAAWNALLKRERAPEDAVVGVIAVSVALSSLWALALPGPGFASREAVAWGAAAGLLEAGYLAALARSLRHAPLGLAYTVARGGALLLVWPVSVALLGERLTAVGAAGAAVLALGLGVQGWPARGALARTEAEARGVAWAAASAACIAGYHLCYKQALAAGAEPPALFTLALGLALPLLALQRARAHGARALWDAVRARPLALGLTGAVCTLSFGLLLVGLARGGAGSVLTLRNTSILFALALGALQGERLGGRQLAGAALVVAGAGLVGWGGV